MLLDNIKVLTNDRMQFFFHEHALRSERIISFVYHKTTLNGAQYDDCAVIPCYSFMSDTCKTHTHTLSSRCKFINSEVVQRSQHAHCIECYLAGI